MSETDLADIWARSLDGLADLQIKPHQRAWLKLTRPLGLVENTALIATPNEFVKEQLETKLRALVTHALSAELGRTIQLAVTVDPASAAAPVSPDFTVAEADLRDLEAPPGGRAYEDAAQGRLMRGGLPEDTGERPVLSGPPPPAGAAGAPAQGRMGPTPLAADGTRLMPHPAPPVFPGGDYRDPGSGGPGDRGLPDGDSGADATGQAAALARHEPHAGPVPYAVPRPAGARLNPKYTFETFVIGSSNRFAHAAAVAVAEAPAKAYNPLFVYGDSGLGKTHLLHAIGHYAQTLYTGVKVRYVSSEEFTNDFINMIRDGKQDGFRRRYRDVDVLLVDDIQFLENKEGTQEEFFHTFNTLHNASKQIVISSDRAPKRLVTLEDRLRSRFEWGLLTDVQPPELETRIAILRRKAIQEGLNAPPEVLEYIASRISTNIRELEGALIRVTAFASLNRQSVDLQLAEIVLKDLIPEAQGPQITIR